MNNFMFDMPTKLYFGENSIENLKIAKNFGDKVLLHYGKSSIKKNGVYDKVVSLLKSIDIEVFELGGVEANPSLQLVREGVEICKKENISLVLAVGGGSVIDSAKGIVLGAKVEDDIWNYFNGKAVDVEPLPLGVILTLPATGSETSPVSIVVDKESKEKKACSSPLLRSKFSILDPLYTYSLPKFQVACGVVDIFSHMIERYFSATENVELTDRLLEGAMKTVVQNGLATVNEPENYKYRSEVMLVGALAHNDALSMGRIGDWGIHSLERIISGYYDNAHGEGLSCIIPAWFKVNSKKDNAKFLQFFKEVFGIEFINGNEDYAIETGIYVLENFFKSLGLNTRFSETEKIKITDEHINQIASDNVGIGNCFKMTKEDIISLLNTAK